MQPLLYRKINEVIDRFRANSSGPREIWVKRLFQALDWGNEGGFIIAPDEKGGHRLLVDNYPVVNILPTSPNEIDSVYRGLNRAYNQDVPWVVATDFRSLGLFGAYWISQPHDIESASAIKLEQDNYLNEAQYLELLTPYSVGRNELNQLYSSFPGRKQRLPIDMHLVEQMSIWRQLGIEALKGAHGKDDRLIHRLINSLFLVRYMEDTDRTGTRLIDLAQSEPLSDFVYELQTIMKRVASRTGYQAIKPSEIKRLEQTPLRNLVKQLYGYPDYGVSYDFSELSVDILGRFYEEYLRSEAIPSRKVEINYTLFETRDFEFADVRHERGVYYTPRFVVDYILNNLIGRFAAANPNANEPTVVDLSCGSGTFLAAALEHLKSRYEPDEDTFLKYTDRLIGFDIDSRATEAATLNLTAQYLSCGIRKPLSPLRINCVDLLKSGPIHSAIRDNIPTDGADIIVGNPPYINYELLKKKYSINAISERFETAKGRIDSYILFVEATVKLLKEGGYGGFVLPNSILRTKSAQTLREYLAHSVDVLEIIDFTDQPVFKGVSTYVCLLLFRKRIPGVASPKMTVARVHSISETPATQLATAVASNKAPDGIEVYQIDQPQSSNAWTLRNATESTLLQRLSEISDCTVGDVLTLRQGVKTGRDDIFLVEASSVQKHGVTVLVSNKTKYLESDLLLPALRMRDLGRWGTEAKTMLIYPYDRKRGELLALNTIKRKYPGTVEYLNTYRSLLAARKSLRGKKWYELIEPRMKSVMNNPEYLVAAEIGLKPIFCRPYPRNSVVIGNFWLTLNDSHYDLDVVLAFLNSSIAEWFLRQISPLLQRGYILLREENISKLHLPRFLKKSDSFVFQELKRLSKELAVTMTRADKPLSSNTRAYLHKSEDQIDSIIIEAMNLKYSEAEYLRNKLKISRGLGFGT